MKIRRIFHVGLIIIYFIIIYYFFNLKIEDPLLNVDKLNDNFAKENSVSILTPEERPSSIDIDLKFNEEEISIVNPGSLKYKLIIPIEEKLLLFSKEASVEDLIKRRLIEVDKYGYSLSFLNWNTIVNSYINYFKHEVKLSKNIADSLKLKSYNNFLIKKIKNSALANKEKEELENHLSEIYLPYITYDYSHVISYSLKSVPIYPKETFSIQFLDLSENNFNFKLINPSYNELELKRELNLTAEDNLASLDFIIVENEENKILLNNDQGILSQLELKKINEDSYYQEYNFAYIGALENFTSGKEYLLSINLETPSKTLVEIFSNINNEPFFSKYFLEADGIHNVERIYFPENVNSAIIVFLTRDEINLKQIENKIYFYLNELPLLKLSKNILLPNVDLIKKTNHLFELKMDYQNKLYLQYINEKLAWGWILINDKWVVFWPILIAIVSMTVITIFFLFLANLLLIRTLAGELYHYCRPLVDLLNLFFRKIFKFLFDQIEQSRLIFLIIFIIQLSNLFFKFFSVNFYWFFLINSITVFIGYRISFSSIIKFEGMIGVLALVLSLMDFDKFSDRLIIILYLFIVAGFIYKLGVFYKKDLTNNFKFIFKEVYKDFCNLNLLFESKFYYRFLLAVGSLFIYFYLCIAEIKFYFDYFYTDELTELFLRVFIYQLITIVITLITAKFLLKKLANLRFVIKYGFLFFGFLIISSLYYFSIKTLIENPTITYVKVDGETWSDVTIRGHNFGVAQYNKATVFLNDQQPRILKWENEKIVVVLDPQAIKNGELYIINVDNKQSNTYQVRK